MPNPATIDDVEARFRPLTPAEQVVAETFLDDAWWLLLGRLPNLEANLDAGTVSTENAVRVVASMVVRVLRNPDGKVEESIDDYRYRRDALVSSGALHVTDDELADLTPGDFRRSRSVRMVAYGDG
jgi:Phage protein Gp19/Gp15/Gp42